MSFARTVLAVICYLLLVLFAIVLLLVNWQLLLWFAVGFGLWLVVLILFKSLSPRFGAGRTCWFLVAMTIAVLGALWFLPRKPPPIQADQLPVGTVAQYKVVVRPSDDKCEVFDVLEQGVVTEEVIPDEDDVAKQAPPAEPKKVRLTKKRKATPTKKGWFVEELQFKPFDPDAQEYKDATVFGQKNAFSRLVFDLTEPWVYLQDLPHGLFCQALDAKADPNPYGSDKENVNWQLHRLDRERGIGFVFVRPPYNSQRWWVNPFLFVNSISAFGVALVTLVLSCVPTMAQKGVEATFVAMVKKVWERLRQRGAKTQAPPSGP